MAWYGSFKPYVPVAKRRAQAARYAANLAKREKRTLCPVKVEGRKIATTFWGQAWCENLESYSDFANRLPRGRTYVRNGSIIDLSIERGTLKALVSGSEVYRVTINIRMLPKAAWKHIKQDCSQSIGSLIELLQGRFDESVMRRLTVQDGGLFPQPHEIEMKCSCPDWAGMCKHVAAVLYGVGARLDNSPELLFTLRDVDHLELISQAVAAENLDQTLVATTDAGLGSSDLGELFGIELAGDQNRPTPSTRRRSRKPELRKAADAATTNPKNTKRYKKHARKRIDAASAAAKSSSRRKRAPAQRQAVTS